MKHAFQILKLVAVMAALLLLAACSGSLFGAPELNGTEYSEPRETPEFTLQNAGGDAVSLDAYEGKVIPIYFGYTFFPDVCPVTMANLARVQGEVDEDGEGMQVLHRRSAPRYAGGRAGLRLVVPSHVCRLIRQRGADCGGDGTLWRLLPGG